MNAELFSVGLAHKVCLAAETQGYTPELLNTLAEDKNLFGQLLQVQFGYAEIKMIENIIDCDADPFIPSGWSVEKHQKGGQFKFDVSQIELYLSAAQKKSSIEGNKLRKELAGKPVLNANVLDYLLKNPHLIPEEWKDKYVFFWGTIYRSSDGNLYVRYLCWSGVGWFWFSYWLFSFWSDFSPAALRAS